MLVLTRKENESITLFTDQGEIVISLTEINGSQAKIGIGAPGDVNLSF